MYEYETDYSPSQDGWFDDQTVKETGFTPEKCMAMWEATLGGFKVSSFKMGSFKVDSFKRNR